MCPGTPTSSSVASKRTGGAASSKSERCGAEPGTRLLGDHPFGLRGRKSTELAPARTQGKLSTIDLSKPMMLPAAARDSGGTEAPATPPGALDGEVAALALSGMARLNLPQLIDAARLLERAGSSIRSPSDAATALEGVAIMDLTGRRPQELLVPGILKPIVAAVLRGGGGGGRGGGRPTPAALRLFPFTDVAQTTCSQRAVAAWRQAATERHAQPREMSTFELAVGREISSWSGVGLVSPLVVGPLRVPYAVSLVGLATHLQENPLGDVGLVVDFNESSAPGGGAEREPSTPADAGSSDDSDVELGSSAVAHDCDAEEQASPETHVLIFPLRERDFYHASASLRGERQRAKTQLLSAEKFAEVSLLRNAGWRVCCVSEHDWTWGLDDDPDTSTANKDLIFRLVANLADD